MHTHQTEVETSWKKCPQNPVLGGELGTCFDIAVLREHERHHMYFSWRPKKSIAVTESVDGIHWDQPRIVLPPNPETNWEEWGWMASSQRAGPPRLSAMFLLAQILTPGTGFWYDSARNRDFTWPARPVRPSLGKAYQLPARVRFPQQQQQRQTQRDR